MKTLAIAAVLAVFAATGCSQATSHDVTPAVVGAPAPFAAMESTLDEPGPLSVESVTSADWVVDRSGLINLDNPIAKAAHLTDGDEPIHLYFHAIHHPTRGTFVIDSGIERAFRDAPKDAVIRGMTSKLAHLDKMTTHTTMGDWLAAHPEPVRGVFLTHLHADHVLGLRDVPNDVPIYVGAGDAEERSFQNVLMSSLFDEALSGKGALRELTIRDGALDVFGDGSFWAISVPGHTKGSTAFVARTTSGPILFTGDACHSRWGWDNGVEPGSFSENIPESKTSLALLRSLAARHPQMVVRLGHQD